MPLPAPPPTAGSTPSLLGSDEGHDVEPLPPLLYDTAVIDALHEDLGLAGDRTTDALNLGHRRVQGVLVARGDGRVAGLPVALRAFRLLDPDARAQVHRGDGADVQSGDALATVTCTARAMLAAERTALNFLTLLSGCATMTRELVAAVAASEARIVPTRKTIPGLRALQRHAVRLGGGYDHRFGLDDAILLKDNHLLLAGGLTPAVRLARRRLGHLVKLQVEVDTLDQLEEALALGVEAILLDNMAPPVLAQAVRTTGGHALLEASGGITPDNAGAIAATGVDVLSVGWLTHSPRALDIALDLQAPGPDI